MLILIFKFILPGTASRASSDSNIAAPAQPLQMPAGEGGNPRSEPIFLKKKKKRKKKKENGN